MDWFSASAFIGAFLGGIFFVIGIIAAFLLWDYFDRRKSHNRKKQTKLPLKNILESQLEGFIIDNFNQLFPDWEIYNRASNDGEEKPTGVQFSTAAGIIDLLCVDDSGDFVVIELKRDRAPDKVVAQIDRYISWVHENLIQSDQKVRGIIIAKRWSDHLHYSIMHRDHIELMAYEWQLAFIPEANIQTSSYK